MAFTDVVLSSLIGTGIGGILVVGATLLTNRFNRSHAVGERHLNDHKENLTIITMYLQNEMSNINLMYSARFDGFIYSPREPNLVRFKYSPSFGSAFYSEQDDESQKIHSIDCYLYKDMENHYCGLVTKLKSAEKDLRTQETELSASYQKLFWKIYESLDNSNDSRYSALASTINRQYTFKNNMDGFCELNSDQGTFLFNLIVDIPSDRWPTLYEIFALKMQYSTI
jgi:hypothetical protein